MDEHIRRSAEGVSQAVTRKIVVDGKQVRLVDDPTKLACAVKIDLKTKKSEYPE